MTRTLRIGLATLAVLAAADVAVLVDASFRRSGVDPSAARTVVGIAGTADLALSSTARWLRHPSHAEPWAAVSDHPSTLDTDPAGAILGPARR